VTKKYGLGGEIKGKCNEGEEVKRNGWKKSKWGRRKDYEGAEK
jgi:hypothetical protein